MNSALLTEEDERLLQFVLPTVFEDDGGRECKRDQQLSQWPGGRRSFFLACSHRPKALFVIMRLTLLLSLQVTAVCDLHRGGCHCCSCHQLD